MGDSPSFQDANAVGQSSIGLRQERSDPGMLPWVSIQNFSDPPHLRHPEACQPAIKDSSLENVRSSISLMEANWAVLTLIKSKNSEISLSAA